MNVPERETTEWAAGWTRRAHVAADLITLRDCVTCAGDAEARQEHIDHLIRIYLPEQGEPHGDPS